MSETVTQKGTAGDIPVYCAFDKIIGLADMKPNPRNPNRHPDDQIELLAKVIKAQGWRAPVTVSVRSGLIVRGHGRFMAAQLLGCPVPVDFQHYENEDEELADLLADNKIAELADVDEAMLADIFESINFENIDVELTGYNAKEYSEITGAIIESIEEETEKDPDETAEPPTQPFTMRGDLWEIGEHRLLCGDSTVDEDVARLMDGEKADMVFTDPPYMLMGNSTGVQGVSDDKLIRPFFKNLLFLASKYTKKRRHVYVCCDYQSAASIHECRGEMQPKNLIVWQKANGGGIGSYYTKIYELIWLFANDNKLGMTSKGIQNKNGVEIKARTINGVPNIWNVPIVQSPQRDHFAQKPVKVVSIAVENSSEQDEIVLDLFGGSGTTLIACDNLNRISRLMEIEPKYCDVIVRRYVKVTGKNDIFLIRNGEKIPVEDTGVLR